MSADGTWKITVNSPMGKQESKLEVRVEGGALVGTQSGQAGSNAITNGKVDGDKVSWSTSITTPFPMTLEFSGVLAGDTLNGKVKAGNFGEFEFAGSRA